MPVTFVAERWIERFRSVHGDRYEYSEFEKVGKNMTVVIVCAEHGDFRKQVSEHWSKGAGCPVCSKANLAPQSNHLSRDQWIARFREAHGERYEYDKFEVLPLRGKATFICREHGEFQQRQDAHAEARLGCDGCKKQRAVDNFLKDARALFGDRYGYDKFEYVSAKIKSIIICPDHGEFIQNPDKHLQSKYPCPECNAAVKSAHAKEMSKLSPAKARISKEEYLSRLILPDTCTVDLREYIGLNEGTVILTCQRHGESRYSPQNLLITANKCNACGREAGRKTMTKGYADFLSKAIEVHGETYSYPDSYEGYVNRKSTVEITCSAHGVFQKKAQNHLSGQGCFRCGIDELIRAGRLTGGYNLDNFAVNEGLGNMPGTVYYLKVGDVYKIGITAQEVKTRVRSIKSTSKLEVTILQTYECSLKEAYVIEQSILKRYEDVRVARRWSTELFSEDILSGKKILDVPVFSEAEIASCRSPYPKIEVVA